MASSTKTKKETGFTELARSAGNDYFDYVQESGERFVELQSRIGKALGVDWITDVQADVTRTVLDTYVSTGRRLVV
jgi:hypothetical protein